MRSKPSLTKESEIEITLQREDLTHPISVCKSSVYRARKYQYKESKNVLSFLFAKFNLYSKTNNKILISEIFPIYIDDFLSSFGQLANFLTIKAYRLQSDKIIDALSCIVPLQVSRNVYQPSKAASDKSCGKINQV